MDLKPLVRREIDRPLFELANIVRIDTLATDEAWFSWRNTAGTIRRALVLPGENEIRRWVSAEVLEGGPA